MTSPFLGVYTAVYAYTPRDDQELTLEEGDLLYILEKSSDDDWWKAKKKSTGEEEEPIGLVPITYIEEVRTFYSRILSWNFHAWLEGFVAGQRVGAALLCGESYIAKIVSIAS